LVQFSSESIRVVVIIVIVIVVAMLRSVLLVLAAGHTVSAFLPADTSRGGAAFIPRTPAPFSPSKTALNEEFLGVENQKRTNGLVIKKSDKAFYKKTNKPLRGAPLTAKKLLPARINTKTKPVKKKPVRIPKKKVVVARKVVPKKKPVVKKKAAPVKKVAAKKKPIARKAKVAPAKKVAVKKAVVAKKEKPAKPVKAKPTKKDKPAKPVKAAKPGKGAKKGAEEPAAAPPKKKFIFF